MNGYPSPVVLHIGTSNCMAGVIRGQCNAAVSHQSQKLLSRPCKQNRSHVRHVMMCKTVGTAGTSSANTHVTEG